MDRVLGVIRGRRVRLKINTLFWWWKPAVCRCRAQLANDEKQLGEKASKAYYNLPIFPLRLSSTFWWPPLLLLLLNMRGIVPFSRPWRLTTLCAQWTSWAAAALCMWATHDWNQLQHNHRPTNEIFQCKEISAAHAWLLLIEWLAGWLCSFVNWGHTDASFLFPFGPSAVVWPPPKMHCDMALLSVPAVCSVRRPYAYVSRHYHYIGCACVCVCEYTYYIVRTT